MEAPTDEQTASGRVSRGAVTRSVRDCQGIQQHCCRYESEHEACPEGYRYGAEKPWIDLGFEHATADNKPDPQTKEQASAKHICDTFD